MAAASRESSATTPALVLGTNYHTELGVIRALARAGTPQFTVDAGTSYVSYSRWYRRLPIDGKADPTPRSLSGFLSFLPYERMVLMPCSDAWAAAVAALDSTLAERFPASLAPRDSVDICLDKARFAETLERLGVPHPRTVCIDDPERLPALWSSLRDPFLKPRDSQAFRARFGAKALRVTTPGEAVIRAREAQQAGLDLLLQEYVPGPATSQYFIDGFVDRTGSVRARFVRRCLRTYSEPFGGSSCTVSIPLKEVRAPLEILDRLLPALRFRGIFGAQFKYDERDGLFKLFDLNTRAPGGVSLHVSCGVDLIAMAYRDALGLPVGTVANYPIGRHWVHHPRDLIAGWRLLRTGRLTPGAWVRTWAGAVDPIFSWSDPAPAAALLLQHFRLAVRRVVGDQG